MEPASLKLVGYESDPGNISRSLIRHEMKMTKHLWSYMKAILAVMNTSWETVKIRSKKNLARTRFEPGRYRRGHAFKFRTSLNFFGPYFHYFLSNVHNSKDHSHIRFFASCRQLGRSEGELHSPPIRRLNLNFTISIFLHIYSIRIYFCCNSLSWYSINNFLEHYIISLS